LRVSGIPLYRRLSGGQLFAGMGGQVFVSAEGVPSRTVAKYLRRGGTVRTPDPKQRWLTFVHNHAEVIVACDFFVVMTATFRTLYVFVLMEVGTVAFSITM